METPIQQSPPTTMYNPGGLGPWFVQLLFHTSDVVKKQTHLCSHTYPHYYEAVMNKTVITSTEKNANTENGWVSMQVIGPFNKWKHALAFQKLWSEQTRGKARRLERGVELLAAFHKQYNLFMESQTKDRETILQEKQRKRRHVSMDHNKNMIPLSTLDQNHSRGMSVSKSKRIRASDIMLRELQRCTKESNKSKFNVEMVERLQSQRRLKK